MGKLLLVNIWPKQGSQWHCFAQDLNDIPADWNCSSEVVTDIADGGTDQIIITGGTVGGVNRKNMIAHDGFTISDYGSGTGGDTSGGSTLTLNDDATGALQIANKKTLFSFSQTNINNRENELTQVINGNASVNYDSLLSGYILGVNDQNDQVIQSSRNSFKAQPDTGFRFVSDFNLRDKVTGVKKRIGIFNINDGVFFGTDTNIELVIGKINNATETVITQANWNRDTCDGTGTSGFNLDPTLPQHIIIDYLASNGVIRISFMIENGDLVLAHEFSGANTILVGSSTAMVNPVLPVSFSMDQTDVFNSILEWYTASISVQGDNYTKGITTSVGTLNIRTPKQVGNSEFTTLLSIQWNSFLPNFYAAIKLKRFILHNLQTAAVELRFYLNPVLSNETNPANYVLPDGHPNSLIIYDIDQVADSSVADANPYFFVCHADNNMPICTLDLSGIDIPFGQDANGLSDTLVICGLSEGTPNNLAYTLEIDEL